METTVGVSGQLPANPSRKQRVWIREAVTAAADYHHRHHIPKHFKTQAATQYGYKRRSRRWQDTKKKLGRPAMPLVFTGKTKQEITSSREIRATSTRGARLVMRASLRGLTSGRFRIKVGQFRLSERQEQIEMRRQEIVAMTPDEITTLARIEEQAYQQQVDKHLTQ